MPVPRPESSTLVSAFPGQVFQISGEYSPYVPVKKRYTLLPKQIFNFPGFGVQLGAGEEHGIVITNQGRAYSWGKNQNKQLCWKSAKRMTGLRAGEIVNLVGVRYASVCSSEDYTVLLTTGE